MLDTRRRHFITLLGGAAVWPLAARAQQQPKMLRVGFVGIQPQEAPAYTNFLKRMAELGYQEGRNFTFDYIQTPDVEGYERNYRELADGLEPMKNHVPAAGRQAIFLETEPRAARPRKALPLWGDASRPRQVGLSTNW